jgi:hypothetical protein
MKIDVNKLDASAQKTEAGLDSMKIDVMKLEAILSELGIVSPAGLLSGLDVQGYLDQLDHVLALAAGERQRLGELLRAAERITLGQLEDALSEQRRSGCKLGDILVEKRVLTQRERDVVLEFQRHQAGAVPAAGKFYLGTILVATGQITRAQLEDALRRQAVTGRRLGDELIESGQASKGQIEGGLLLQRKLVTAALIIAMMLVAPLALTVPSAQAGQTASMQVSVTVIANTKVRTDYQATQLKITEADVTRGYIDAPAASRFLVSTNSRSGYHMEFYPIGNLFESVQIEGLGNAVRLGADGGTIVQRDPLLPNMTHELSYRFILRPDVQSGSYQWPLLLSVRPL